MSCPHGNSIGYCDICDEIDAAWKAGEASGKRSVEHCTCPACQITHANDCAVHNMPAMPTGPCDCGAAHPARSGVVSDEDVRDAERYRWLRNDPPTWLSVREKTNHDIKSDGNMVYLDSYILDRAIDSAIKGERHEL